MSRPEYSANAPPSGRHDQFAEDLARFEAPQPLAHFLEAEDGIDLRLEASGGDEVERLRDILSCIAVRAEDPQLEGPDVADVLHRVVPARRAACEKPAA